ncbi:GlsB/YeaQ/YmgE family stress response membrane protein [Actinomadura algeriensis]|uniref:Membrane protein YeaQ/YmgE (Transglycosylase-associated protein family) n=1 Tax=Actinomadura algeriensis TaxID=1679523 RepID=A0ABR9K010_9ACTN|nr:GlsB/YeaQ/YmgE family stress response membrane protein [Actinomadura algeriensis]MBE1536164.1 putative membrane protein YeaQ/YmgE (transglycosylase-associated protein family) [Actinomadura algeriensis]
MTLAGSIAAIVLGAAVGALGRLITPGRPSMPAWATIAVGVVAAFAGTGLFGLFGSEDAAWGVRQAAAQVGTAVAAVILVVVCWPAGSGR